MLAIQLYSAFWHLAKRLVAWELDVVDARGSEGSRLVFWTAFMAITATSFCFILRALIVDDWGAQFSLTETQKGELLGVGLWPFAITIVLLSFVIERIGFKIALWFAAACHVGGLAVLLAADGYWPLYLGTFVMALGNGAVEAAANPAIATAFAHDKSRWLNRLHAAWPGGMIAGGLLAIALGSSVGWQLKASLMIGPILVYVALLTKVRFPVSERVLSGVRYRAMLAETGYLSALIVLSLVMLEIGRVAALSTLVTCAIIGALAAVYAFYARSPGRPIFILLLLLMIPLAITELSTDSWITSLMEPAMSGLGMQAGWVLVYTSLIVFVVRIFAGHVIDFLSPLGTLAIASALAAAGLYMLANSAGLALLAAATLYGIGKSFFWGTSLAVTSEQFPRGGAMAINLVAGAGMLSAGIVGSVFLGTVQDVTISRELRAYDLQEDTSLSADYLIARSSVFGEYEALDVDAAADAPPGEKTIINAISDSAKKSALRDVALLPMMMLFFYLALVVVFRRRGGYRPVVLASEKQP